MVEPEWLEEVLGGQLPSEGEAVTLRGVEMVRRGGILRARRGTDADEQAQTARAFGYKWQRRETFESDAMLERRRRWLRERYGDVTEASWWCGLDSKALLLDAGCGAGSSAIGLFGDRLRHVRYLGVDVSEAVDVARSRFAERSLGGAFLQADLTELPLPKESIAVILSEGVLHHTPSTRRSLQRLASLLVPGGRLLFYVYRRKGPIREFTDDFIRREISRMTPAGAWEALVPLTKLGIALGDLDVEIDIPEDVGILGIPKGRTTIQRLFYWHVFKCFYDPRLSLDEMNHINFDWYAPAYAHRQSPEEVRRWCAEADLEIEREVVEEAGLSIIARRRP